MESDGQLERTPTLANLAGFGTGLFGARDRRADGSSIRTLCLSAFFVPIVPISAYRVVERDQGNFDFYDKVPLSRAAHVYRIALAFAVAAAITLVVVGTILRSPTRQAKQAAQRANAAAEAGDVERAIRELEAVVADYDGRADNAVIERAAASALALRISQVPSPLTIQHLDQALEVIRRHAALGRAASAQKSSQRISEVVLRWAGELADADGATVHSAVALLDAGLAVARQQARKPMADLRTELRIRLAATLTPNRPVDALRIFVSEGQTEAAGDIAMRLTGAPSLLIEAASEITWWLSRSSNAARIARVREALDAAEGLATTSERRDALASATRGALKAALALAPADNQLATALASIEAAENPAVAIKRLRALGKPGWLTGPTQAALGGFESLAGNLPAADQVLSELIRFRLPIHTKAKTAYRQAAANLRERLAERADSGMAEPAVMAAIRSGDGAKAQEAFEDWVARSLATDSHLSELKRGLVRSQYIASAAELLADVKMRRAHNATGEARDRFVREAESTLMSVTDQVGGNPLRPLRLAMVYHRLGKREQGERLLDSALADGDSQTRLAIVDVYRQLGATARARSVATAVYKESKGPTDERMRDGAALRLAAMAPSLESAEMWLTRAAPRSPDARARLSEVRAELVARAGDETTARSLLNSAIAHFETRAKHDAGSANNAGVALTKLYRLTGDRAHLTAARRWFEESLRLDPQNAIAADNLAEQLELAGWLDIVSEIAETNLAVLRLDRRAVMTLVSDLAAGSLRTSLVAAGRQSAYLQRSRALTTRQRILAPTDARGWSRALAWALVTRDIQTLTALRTSLQSRNRPTDTAPRKHRGGELRTEVVADATQEIDRLLSLTPPNERQAAGLANWRLSSEFARRARNAESSTDALADLKRAFAASREATNAWPALANSSIRTALELALARTKARFVGGKASLAIIEAIHGPGADSLRKTLAADEAIRIAAALALATRQLEPSRSLLALGLASGNRRLIARGNQARDEQFRRLADEVAELLGLRPGGRTND